MAKRSEATAVDEGIDIKARNTSRIIGRHLHINVAWMAAAVDPVDFLTVKGDADGAARFASQQSSAHLVREGVGFSTKATAHKGADDVDLVHGDIQHGRKCTVGVMRHLLRRVELKSSIRVPMGHNGMRFSEPVVNAHHGPRAMG